MKCCTDCETLRENVHRFHKKIENTRTMRVQNFRCTYILQFGTNTILSYNVNNLNNIIFEQHW